MTNPNPDNETDQSANRRVWLLWLSRGGMAFGVIVLVGIAAGAWWAWVFVNRELAPLVERNLSQTFQRPVRVGKVERFGWNGLRFGPSEIPATATDPDRATAQAVEAAFNPLQLLLTRTLELNLTLVNPDVYIEQDNDGRWITTTTKASEAKGPIKTVLNSVQVDNAKAVLLPRAKPGNPRVAVAIAPLSGNAQFSENGQRIRFDLQGQLAQTPGTTPPPTPTRPTERGEKQGTPDSLVGIASPSPPPSTQSPSPSSPFGIASPSPPPSTQSPAANFKVSGEYLVPSQQANLQLQAQNFPVTEIDRLVQLPIVDLKAGRVSGNLNVKYNPKELPFVLGIATLQDIALTSQRLPVPVTNLNGVVQFTGEGVNLNNVSTLFGQIPVVAGGSADLQKGLNLNVNVPRVAIATVTQTFKIQPPVPVSGEVGLATNLTGTIQQPLVLGEVSTTKPTQVDKLIFNKIATRFAFAPNTQELALSNIQIQPAAGGTITGKGNLKLGQQSGVVIDLQAQNLPADAIAQTYNANLPPNIKVGNLAAQTQIFGRLNDIRIVSRFQAPSATYPTTGELAIAGGQIALRNATVTIPGGTVQASASIGIADRSWQAEVQTTGLPVNSILAITQSGTEQKPQSEIPLPVQQAIVTVSARLSGTLDSFKLEDIQATAQANVRVADGNVQVRQAQLNRGRWQGLINASGINLALFPQVPPQLRSTFNGEFRVAGNVNATNATNIQAVGRGRVNVAGGNVEILQAGLRNGAWEATVRANNVNLGQIAQVPPELRSPFNGQFLIAGNLDPAGQGSIKAVGSGNIQFAGGNVNLRQVELNQGNFRATIAASGVQLGRLPQVPKNLQAGSFNGQFQVAGNLNNLSNNNQESPLSQIQVVGQGNLQVAGGNVRVRQVQLDRGNWQALVDANGVQLARFPQVPPQLQGTFSGQLQAAGNVNTFTQKSDSPLSEIQATARGTLQLASGTVRLRQVQLERGNFQALVDANNLQLARFPQVPKQLQGTFSGEVQAAGNVNTLTQKSDSPLSEIQATARGTLQIASGTVQLRQVQLDGGNFQALVGVNNIQLARFPQVPKELQGTLSGEVQAAGNVNTLTQKSDSPLSEIQATARGTLQIASGTVQLRQVQLERGNFQALVGVNNIQLARFPQVPKELQGTFSGQLQAAGNLNTFTEKSDSPLSEIQANATGTLQLASGTVRLRQVQLDGGNFQALVDANNLQLARFPQVPKELQGTFSGQLQAAGNIETLTTRSDKSPLSQIQATAQGTLQLASGTVRLRQVQLDGGNFQALVDANNLQLARFPQVPKQLQGTFSGEVQAAGNIETLTTKSDKSPLSEIQATAQGTLQITGDGTVQIRQAQLDRGNWQVALDANRIQLSRFPQVPPQFRGIFSGQLQASGNIDILTRKTDELPLSEIQGNGRGILQTPNGRIEIQEAQIASGRWAAAVNLAQVQLDRFSQQLQGQVNGDLKVGGSLAALTRKDASPLSDIQAAGDLNFTQAPYLNRPLNVAFQWNGQQLQIQRATAPGLDVNGVIAANFDINNRPEITDLNLNVRAEDFNIQTLPINLPQNVALAGLVDFNGQISGRPNALNANGDLQLQNFAVANFKFDPVLRGNVQAVAGRGVRLQLQGDRDQIALELDQNYRPETFLLRRGEILAQGRKQGDLFLVDVANVPVGTLKDVARNFVNLPPEIAVQQINGQLSGNFAINFDTLSVAGNNVTIAQPSVGDLDADSLTANFRYANGTVEILSSELRKDDSIYALSGRVNQLGPNAQVQGKLNIEKGKIENILAAVDWFNLRGLAGRGGRNYGGAASVQTSPVGVAQLPLESQLQRFSEINALVQQQRLNRLQTTRIPDIRELKGNFNGSVDFAGIPTNIQASFNLNGENWQLGNYNANQVLAQGTYNNGNLNVQALRVQSGDTLVAFNGSLGFQQQNGQLQIQNFPVEALNNIVDLPVYVTGKLNGTANIAGNLEDPQATGQIILVDGTINGTKVQSAQANFSYDNARLNFDSQVLINPPQPILISGSVPYKLPFARVQPDSDNISLDVNVQNEGLALLNLVSRDQIQWVSGVGQVQLQVRGTLARPVPTGIATLQDATIGGQVLPEPLKNVTGVVRFQSDRILVENFAGTFTNGQIVAQGTIPILRPLDLQDPDRNNPLNVSLDRAAINLKGLYQGKVNGNVAIAGSVINPLISGDVELADGQVFLPQTGATAAATTEGGQAQRAPTTQSPLLEFRNFQLTLTNRVNITQQPILSVRGTGTLTLNGSLDAPRPEGTIDLNRGSVNLFAARFRLENDYENTAVFVPSQGFDPTLDVRLVSTVSEVTQARLPASPFASEINDAPATGYGSLQSIRVQAIVQGRASQLEQNLELRSDPPRTESEIVALIGGSFISGLGQGGDGLAGIAGLASSVILPGLEGVFGNIADSLGLDEFRIFPTAVTSEKESSSSVLGLAAEVGVDITNNLSASVLRILTPADQPTQFGLRYRLNSEFTVRGSTDFSGDSRAVIEFQRRF